MKITMYELLGMVKDGKAPKKIMYNNVVWEYVNHEQDYRSRHNAELFFNDEINNTWIMTHLNTQIKILEEEEKKIPEKFKINYEIDEENTINMEKATMLECDLACRINEIIDYLDYLKSKGE